MKRYLGQLPVALSVAWLAVALTLPGSITMTPRLSGVPVSVATSVAQVVVPVTKTVLVLGDSIVAPAGGWMGGPIANPSPGWAGELCRQMSAYANTECNLINYGLPGKSCGWWPSRIQNLLVTYQPDIVILACGTNDRQSGADNLGTWFRQTVETIRVFRNPPIPIAVSLIGYSEPLIWGTGVLNQEAAVNDVLYSNMQYYLPSGWFGTPAMVLDFQQIPSTAEYYVEDNPADIPGGVHPTLDRGVKAYGRVAYDRMAPGMGWPASPEPPLCGQNGRRPGYPLPGGIIKCAPFVPA